jgi:pyruvate dehydrogenase E2 component (dihydrolipoamide acetyltransferase)
LAQRLARERGVDLKQVRGSGAEGKVVARDLEKPAAAPSPAQSAPKAPAVEDASPEPAATEAKAPRGKVALSKMRQTIARRMSEAKNGVPHFYVVAEIGMDEASRLLEALKQQVDDKITVNHVVAKAAAMALEQHPRVNGLWADGAVEFPESINIGLAVAVEDGLLLPVIHGCEKLSLAELAAEARRLVGAARSGRFSGDDLKGGTFTISNLGMLDVDEFSAIINPPQAAILAVGSIKERPIVRGGQLAVGRTMRVTLSCDHRQLNGVEGARFLETLKAILENPLRMVV